MIARIWHGAVPPEKEQAYLKLMLEVAIPEYEATPGNRGAWCMVHNEDSLAHFQMLTFWDSVEAVKLFAGEDYLAAKYYDFDTEYLVEMEPRVRQYELYGAV